MPHCIYCWAEKPVAEFNAEHVLPRSFGTFRGALTLARPRKYRVCAVCNSALGNLLDRMLARGSFEAFLRVETGQLRGGGVANLRYDRLVLTLLPPDPLAPMLLRFVPSPDGSEIGVAPLTQLRLSVGDGPLTCIAEDGIARDLPPLLAAGPPKNVGIFWHTSDPEGPRRIEEKAKAAGLTQPKWTGIGEDVFRAGPELIEANLRFTIDSVTMRAVAKIAYEYFFYVLEDLAPRLIHEELLRPIRDFIRNGNGDWRAFVAVSNQPILASETPRLRRSRDHLLALRWDKAVGAPIVAQVSLFNDLTYNVKICEAPFLVWHSIARGHHFGRRTGEVKPLLTGHLIRPPHAKGPRGVGHSRG